MDMKTIDNITGVEFERFIRALLEKIGVPVIQTPESGDYGADIIAVFNNAKFVIQCKRYNGTVGIAAIQEVCGAVKYYHATVGAVITNNYFSRQAERLAAANGIILINRNRLKDLIAGADPKMYLYDTHFSAVSAF